VEARCGFCRALALFDHILSSVHVGTYCVRTHSCVRVRVFMCGSHIMVHCGGQRMCCMCLFFKRALILVATFSQWVAVSPMGRLFITSLCVGISSVSGKLTGVRTFGCRRMGDFKACHAAISIVRGVVERSHKKPQLGIVKLSGAWFQTPFDRVLCTRTSTHGTKTKTAELRVRLIFLSS
jgi:hypothetical protein